MTLTIRSKQKLLLLLWAVVLLTVNEFTLVIFDNDPPISESMLLKIRGFNIFVFVLGLIGHSLVGQGLVSFLLRIRKFTSYFTFYLFLFICFDLVLGLFGETY